MTVKRVVSLIMVSATLGFATVSTLQAQQRSGRIYNTAKQKLMEGKQIFGGMVISSDPNIYCAMANAGFDFLWIEMQHSPLTYQEVARMIWACRDAPAIPIIRVPDATEGDIQKAMDIGALGIVIPMVDTVEEAQRAVNYAKFPPMGRRSRGSGQYGALWGDDYRETINDNLLLAVMIETPAGVARADEIAAVAGIDVVAAASGDLQSFSGYAPGDPRYEDMITKIREGTLKAGKKLAGPLAWQDRPGFSLFWSAYEHQLIRMGAEITLGKGVSGAGPYVATGDEPRRR